MKNENLKRFYQKQGGQTAYRKKKRQALRLSVLSLLGGRCASPNCRWQNEDGSFGCTEQKILQVDHIKNNGAAERKELQLDRIRMYQRILKHENPFQNYQLLCANCNWLKFRNSVV